MIATTVTIPAGARGIDSVQKFTSAQIRSLGGSFTCRYYAPFRPDGSRNPKCLTPPERVELHAGGIAIVPNWESSADRPLSGAGGGLADGHEFARQLVLDGVPNEALVVISNDQNATAANRAPIEAYFRAALGELARVGYTHRGGYGDTDLFDWLDDLDIVGWLMVSKSFSDGSFTRVHVAQQYQSAWNVPRTVPLAGIPNNTYDPNNVLVAVPGVWLPHVAVARPDATPDPTPVPILEEDDMPKLMVLDSESKGSCLLTIRDDGSHKTEGFDSGEERAGWVQGGVPVVPLPDDVYLNKWSAGSTPDPVAVTGAQSGPVDANLHVTVSVAQA